MRRALCLALLLAPALALGASREQAEELYRQGKFQEAAAEVRAVLQASPRDAPAHKLLGGCLINLGDADGAVAEYQRFLELAPGHPEARSIRQMVQAYQKGDGPAPAEAEAGRHRPEPEHIPSQEHPLPAGDARKTAATLRAEADRLVRQAHFEDALPKLRQVVALDPSEPEAHQQLGACLAYTGRSAEAAAEYRQFLTLAPNHPEAPRIRALLLAMEQRQRGRGR